MSRWSELLNCQEGQAAKIPSRQGDTDSNTRCDRNEIVKGKCLFRHGGNCADKNDN